MKGNQQHLGVQAVEAIRVYLNFYWGEIPIAVDVIMHEGDAHLVRNGVVERLNRKRFVGRAKAQYEPKPGR